ncbi:MAG: alpha/beta hydrolase [Anaerolineae bacterium]|nr:alpha/beta hydrolase [Anaerolineae bacterium]
MAGLKTWIGVSLSAVGLGAWGWVQYRRARQSALQRLRDLGEIIQTDCGPIEYVSVGEGPAVLIAHGILGNYEHSMVSARSLEDTFKVISVSRPGYGRTPPRTGRSARQQADAYAALLDELGIEQAGIVAISGGGPSGLQFALHYPERCTGLVLISAVSRPLQVSRLRLSRLLNLFLRARHFDLTMWLAVNVIVHGLPLLYFFNRDLKRRIYDDPEGRQLFTDVMRSFFPSSPARDGYDNDIEIFAADVDYGLSYLGCPVLIMHGINDGTIPVEEAYYSAEHIPDSRLIVIQENAEHAFYITHRHQVWPVIREFLSEQISN